MEGLTVSFTAVISPSSNFNFFENIIVKFCPSEIMGTLKESRLYTDLFPSPHILMSGHAYVTKPNVWYTRGFCSGTPGSTSRTVISWSGYHLHASTLSSKIKKAVFVLLWVRIYATPEVTKILSPNCSSQKRILEIHWAKFFLEFR